MREMGRAWSQKAVLCVAFGFWFCGKLNMTPEWPCPIPGTCKYVALHSKRNFASEIEDLKMGRRSWITW